MGRVPEFTLERFHTMLLAARERNVTLKTVELPRAAYDCLRRDVKEKLNLELPEHPEHLLFGGVRIQLWSTEHVKVIERAAPRNFHTVG